MDSFTWKGLWFLPQDPDHQFAGILSFDPIEGPYLEVVGENLDFTEDARDISQGTNPFGPGAHALGTRTIPLINGYTEKGRPVSLFLCHLSITHFATGYSGDRLFIEYVFVGCHFQDRDDVRFTNVWITYEQLERWYGDSGIQYVINENKTEHAVRDVRSASITYVPPSETEFEVGEYQLTLTRLMNLTTDSIKEVGLETRPFWHVKCPSPRHWLDIKIELLNRLQSFLAFGMGTSVVPHYIFGEIDPDTNSEADTQDRPASIKIYYRARGAKKTPKILIPIFRVNDVLPELPVLLQTWFANSDRLQMVYELYLGFYYLPPIYSNLVFLTLCQIVEAYFREMVGGQYMNKESWRPIYDELISVLKDNKDVQSPHLEKLKRYLEHGYEYSLRKRLKVLLEDHLSDYATSLKRGIGADFGNFASVIAATRNHWTHLDDENTSDLAITDPDKLPDLVTKMRFLITMCLFKSLNFSPQLVEKLARNRAAFP